MTIAEIEPKRQRRFRAVYLCEGKHPNMLHSGHEVVVVRQLASSDEPEPTIRCQRHDKTATLWSVESKPIQE